MTRPVSRPPFLHQEKGQENDRVNLSGRLFQSPGLKSKEPGKATLPEDEYSRGRRPDGPEIFIRSRRAPIILRGLFDAAVVTMKTRI